MTFAHPLTTILQRTASVDFLFLSVDPTLEKPDPKDRAGKTPDGYLHTLNDPTRHQRRSARPKPVTFESVPAALGAIAEAGYITTPTTNVRTGAQDGYTAHRDTDVGRAALKAFNDAVDSQVKAYSLQKEHAGAVKERRAALIAAEEGGIPQHMLAINFNLFDSQVSGMYRPAPPSRMSKAQREGAQRA